MSRRAAAPGARRFEPEAAMPVALSCVAGINSGARVRSVAAFGVHTAQASAHAGRQRLPNRPFTGAGTPECEPAVLAWRFPCPHLPPARNERAVWHETARTITRKVVTNAVSPAHRCPHEQLLTASCSASNGAAPRTLAVPATNSAAHMHGGHAVSSQPRQSRPRSVCGTFLVQLILNFSQDSENTRLANASFGPPRRCVLRPCPAPNKCRAHA